MVMLAAALLLLFASPTAAGAHDGHVSLVASGSSGTGLGWWMLAGTVGVAAMVTFVVVMTSTTTAARGPRH